MKLSSSLRKQIGNAWSHFDPFSLQVRLSVGIAAVCAVGLSSVAVWTTCLMQQILINTHLQSTEYIAERFPHDVELWSEILPVETALFKAIDNLTNVHTLLWVKRPNGTIPAKSAALKTPADPTAATLMSLTNMPLKAQVYEVNGHYFVLSSRPLQFKGKALGQMFVAMEISRAHTTFLAMIRSLGIASFLSLLAITSAIALYIQRSLQPLRLLSQLAGTISVDEARARATGGHGLGLAIVKTLVEAMAGNVTVRSNLSEGSTFTVTLPTLF